MMRIVGFVLLNLFTMGFANSASLLPPSTFVMGHACLGSGSSSNSCSGTFVLLGGPSAQNLFYASTLSDSVLGSTYTVSANAISTYGVLRSASTTALKDPRLLSFTDQNIAAIMVDQITVTFGSLTGGGSMLVGATVSGTESSSGSGIATEAAFLETFFGDPNEQSFRNTTGLVAFPHPINFTFGVPFNLIFGITTFTDEGSGNGMASSAFFNTAELSELLVFDANGNPITNPIFTSGSGTQYTAFGVVPEPTTTLLLFTALAVLGLRTARRLKAARTS